MAIFGGKLIIRAFFFSIFVNLRFFLKAFVCSLELSTGLGPNESWIETWIRSVLVVYHWSDCVLSKNPKNKDVSNSSFQMLPLCTIRPWQLNRIIHPNNNDHTNEMSKQIYILISSIHISSKMHQLAFFIPKTGQIQPHLLQRIFASTKHLDDFRPVFWVLDQITLKIFERKQP